MSESSTLFTHTCTHTSIHHKNNNHLRLAGIRSEGAVSCKLSIHEPIPLSAAHAAGRDERWKDGRPGTMPREPGDARRDPGPAHKHDACTPSFASGVPDLWTRQPHPCRTGKRRLAKSQAPPQHMHLGAVLVRDSAVCLGAGRVFPEAHSHPECFIVTNTHTLSLSLMRVYVCVCVLFSLFSAAGAAS